MKKLLILLILSLNMSCSDNEPECIQELIDEFKIVNKDRSFTFIYEFEQDGITYYIFDNGIAFDAIANVYDEECAVVCSYGGLRANNPNPCDQYQDGINRAKQIWPT